MWHGKDPGYVPALAKLGVTSHFGLQMANGGSWLGMPEFPYYASDLDIRKPNQAEGGGVVCLQWDFCGGWHFLGPQIWHYNISNNDWDMTGPGLRAGIEEAKNLADMSGHPAFICPLYDGPITIKFVERYLRFIAFEIPKEYKLVFARAVDIAGYYRRHFKVTPRTIFVSKTHGDHVFYDAHWGNEFSGTHLVYAREKLAWLTRPSIVFRLRKNGHLPKDRWSQEYLVVEDQKRSIRFEREAANPLWWFDYTNQDQEVTPQGSTITWVETPDVDVVSVTVKHVDPPHIRNLNTYAAPKWIKDRDGLKLKLKVFTEVEFPDYATAIWGLPKEFAKNPDPARIRTNAMEFIVAYNTDKEYHLVLVFDLKPDLELRVIIDNP